MNDLLITFPEVMLLSLACIGLMIELFCAKKIPSISYYFSQAALIITAVCCWRMPSDVVLTAFNGQFIADPFAQVVKLFILGVMFFVLLYSRNYAQTRHLASGEFHALALFSTLGMLCLVSANSFLMLYLGLELLSLPLYALVALQRDSKMAQEASMKYFVMGALASGMLLYGMSLLYGVSGSIQLSEIAQFLQNTPEGFYKISLIAMGFMTVGVAFKLGAVPFHMWVPDVYQGAPTNITLLIGSAPKIAAFALAFRLFHDALTNLSDIWMQVLVVIALLSLVVGNIGAIVQTNVKRLLAYSTIAHVGYLFLAFLAAPYVGYAPALFYILIYAIVALVAFGIIIYLSVEGYESDTIDDLKGLAERSPWLAFLMLLVMFSLAGVPPTAGFYAKFMVLSALVDANLTWLAGVAVIFSIIGAYFYLKIIRAMYFEAPKASFAIQPKPEMYVALSLNGLAVLALGILPAPLFMICQMVFKI